MTTLTAAPLSWAMRNGTRREHRAAEGSHFMTALLAGRVDGAGYAALQGQAMMWGALALLAYSIVVCHLLMHWRWNALLATISALLVWLCVAFGIYFAVGGSA